MGFLDATGITTLVNKLKEKFQPILVSGVNIKTVNNGHLLGSGNLNVTSSWYGTSSTGANTVIKSVDCDGFALAKGSVLSVYFSNANTSTQLQIRVNDGLAHHVYKGSISGSSSNPITWPLNSIVTFIFDGSYWRYLGAINGAGDAHSSANGGASWYCTSSSVATASAKEGTASYYKLYIGALVSVRFTYANTYTNGALTLNISGSGAYPIFINGETTSSTNTLLWDASDVLLFIYTGTYYAYITKAKQIPTNVSAFVNDAGYLTSSSTIDASKVSGTLPASTYTDTNDAVTQTYTSTSTSGTYQLLFSSSVSDTSTHTEGARKTATLTFTPNPAGDDTGSRLNVTSIVDIGRINFYNTSNNASNVGTGIALNVNTTGTKDLYWRSADGVLNLRHYNAARGTGGTITNQFVDGAITLDPGASSDNDYYATLRLESYSGLGVSAGYSRIRPNNIYLRDGNDNYAQLTATSIPTTQTATSTNANYELLFSNTADNTTRTETTRKASSLLYNPSSQQLTIGASSYTQRITASSNSIVGHAGFEDYISESSGNYFGQLNKGVLRLRYNSLGTAGDLAINAASSLSATCQGLMISGNNDVDYLGTGNYNVPNFANVTSGSELTATHLTIKNANGSTQFDRTGLTINDGTNDHTITATKVDNWDSAIRSAGTGLSKSGTTLNHSNSVSEQTTQAVYPIKIDAQGHISAYGSAVTNIVRTTSTQTLTNKTYTTASNAVLTFTNTLGNLKMQGFSGTWTFAANGTNTLTLTKQHIYLMILKRMNNSNAGGVYIIAPHETTGSVTALHNATNITVSQNKLVTTFTSSASSDISNMYYRVFDLG